MFEMYFVTDLTTFATFAPFAPPFWILSSEGSFLGRGFIGKLGRALSSAAITTVRDPGYKNYYNFTYYYYKCIIFINH